MKPSNYNYILDDGDTTVFYNGITEAFFRVPAGRRGIYETIISAPDIHRAEFGPFLDRMERDGFIVPDSTDEMETAEAKFKAQLRPSTYYLMVLPTYQCNLRCWYCTQHHQDMWMSEETVSLIRKRIIRMLSQPGIKHFHLSWFGGEPLMAYDIVLGLTRFGCDKAAKLGKTFSCNITTNSTLLDDNRIEQLREAGVTGYQITIDGDRATHDKVKVLPKGRSAFDTALHNVDRIGSHTYCSLRFNYTHKTLKPDEIIADIRERLSPASLPNIQFNLHKVWQEDEAAIDPARVNRLFGMATEMGLKVGFPGFGTCYVDFDNFECIFPNGRVGLCDNNDPKDNPGILMPDGSVSWPERINSGRPMFEDNSSECHTCRYAPVCGGQCPAKRQKMIEDGMPIGCIFDDHDSEMLRLLLNECRSRESSKQSCTCGN